MTDTVYTPSRFDTGALWLAILFGAGTIVWTIVSAVTRIAEIAPNRDVPVPAAFADTPATLPIGPGGAEVQVVAERVVLTVSDMPPITLWSLILAEVVTALATVLVIALTILVIRNIITGRAFDASTVGYVGIATLAVGAGWGLSWLFTTMGANGGAAALAGEPPQNTAFVVEPTTIFAIAALGGLTAAFQIGHKLRTFSEGLV